MTKSNRLMPALQFIAAIVLLSLWALMALGPMVGWGSAESQTLETQKNIMFILVGFLFGSSANSSKKDDQTAALTAAVISSPSTPVKVDDSTPIKTQEVSP